MGLVCDMRARLWAARWRERFRGYFGPLPTRSPFSAEDGRSKVLCGVDSGTRLGPPLCQSGLTFCTQSGLKLVQFLFKTRCVFQA